MNVSAGMKMGNEELEWELAAYSPELVRTVGMLQKNAIYLLLLIITISPITTRYSRRGNLGFTVHMLQVLQISLTSYLSFDIHRRSVIGPLLMKHLWPDGTIPTRILTF
jgi:hypothetical protein